jgi:hypothetical protein
MRIERWVIAAAACLGAAVAAIAPAVAEGRGPQLRR